MRNKIFILINLLFLISFVSAISSPPVRFWGFGDIVIGDLVEVYDNDGILCGQSIVEHEGRYALDCSGDDPATSEDEGANEGEIIIFKINGKTIETSENAIWNSGEFKQIDLILGILEDENPADNETAEETENETIGEDETTTEENNQPESGGNSGNSGGNSQTSENENPITGSVIDNQDTKKYKSEKESESENLIQDANSAPETSKITGGVIGTGKKIVNGGLYFIGILLIGFIALKLFIKVKRNSQPKKIKIIKYSDWINQKRNRKEIKFIFIILFGILLSINFVSAAQPPDCQMYSDAGGAIINVWNENQDLAPIGAIITAYDADGTLSGNFTITTAGQFSMGISGDDPGTGEDEGAEDGDTITFYIDGDYATVYGDATWNSAEFHKVNLTSTNDAPEIDSLSGPSGTVLGGSSQTVSITSHDDDHSLGTADQVKIYVCKTNSASDNAGCVMGQEYCSSGLTADDPSCSFNVESDDTTHNYYSFVMDEHGRISGSTTAFPRSYITDSTAPEITSIVPVNNSWTNDVTPLITVNTNEGSECKYSATPEITYASKTGMSGTGTSHTATFPDMGADGTYYFYFQCNDTVGNLMLLATEYNYTIKLDTVKPVTNTNYTGNNIWFNTTQNIWLNFTDASPSSGKEWTKYCLTGGCNPTTGTTYTETVSVSSEQITYFRYASKDGANNIETTNELIIKIDKTAPTTSDDYSYDNIWHNTDANITLNENCAISGCNWTKYCNDTDGTCIPDTIYSGGTIDFSENRTLRYRSFDNAGNLQDIQEVIILIDKTIPTITDDYVNDDVWINVSSGDITFTLDDTGGSELRTDPAAMMYCTGAECTPNTNLSAPYTISSITTNTNTIYRYQAYDNSGSGSEIGSFTVKIDKSAPNTDDDYAYDDTWINQDASIVLISSDQPADNSGVNWTKYCNDTDGTCIPDTIYSGGTIDFITDGTSYLRYHSLDNVSNLQDIQTVIIKIDKQNVSIANASISIENGSIYATSTTLNFNYSGFEDQAELSEIAGYYYNFINNEGTSSGTWDTDLNGILSGASQGNVTVFVWAKDNAGNIGLAVNDSIIVDSIAPSFTNWNNTKIIMSDTIPMTINFTIIEETSGIRGLPTIRYKYGDDAWSNWTNTSLITGKNYTFNIPDPTWYNYYNKNIYWQVNAVDIAGNSANSSIQSYLVGSDEPAPIVIRKNIEYQNQTDFNITYLVTNEIYNTLNDTDITDVVFTDSDVNDTGVIFDLVEGEIKTREKYIIISKDASNKAHTFQTAVATWNGNTFTSNILSISIPGYGGPFDIEVDAPTSVSPSTPITADIDLINMNQDVSKDVRVDYWITDTENNTISGLEGMKMVLANSLENTSTTGNLTSPSSSGTYRFWAKVTWITGLTAETFDSFTVATSSTGDTGDTGGSSSGGGGKTTPSITGKAIERFLFDVKVKVLEKYRKVFAGETIVNEITLYAFGETDEEKDITVVYYIRNSEGVVIGSKSSETVAVRTKTSYVKEFFIPKNTEPGEYEFVVDAEYTCPHTVNETDVSSGSSRFTVIDKEEPYYSPLASLKFNWLWIIIPMGVLIIFLIILLFKRKKKKVKAKRKRGFEFKLGPLEIKFKFVLLILSGIVLIGILGIAGKSITGFAVNNFNSVKKISSIFYFIFIIGILGFFIFIYRKNIKKIIEHKQRNKHATNSLKGLIKKKVYTDEGDYIGKVQEAILGKNKIDSLRIKLNKKLKKKVKGIIVKYKDVRNVGHVVIVDGGVEEFLED